MTNNTEVVAICPSQSKKKSIMEKKLPIVYCEEYNIRFLGIEKLHPFDSQKWGRVYKYLKESGAITDDNQIHNPSEATAAQLLQVHTKTYLNKLKWSFNVAAITEIPPVAFLPNLIVQRKVLKPLRHQTNGTIKAADLALEHGWSINIGGGFHHCSSERGGGFCAYADITLAIHHLLDKVHLVKNVMIVDLDAHQGNGHERDFIDDKRVYIMDVYNKGIYPRDTFAKKGINKRVELDHMTTDSVYLDKVHKHLFDALKEFTPDIIVYNAGTDILEGDPLGLLAISPQGIIDRDKMIFSMAKSKNIPVLMVTSGGYQRRTARIIADSILNLFHKDLISLSVQPDSTHPSCSKLEKKN
ncbi:Histone deacetylase 11 [Nymphon striatum]|nr:Histone deacetylase 11 [Nymphon striatum]